MEIRRLHQGDGPTLRDIRLRALEDAPYAFASWRALELAFEGAVWEERIASGAVFVALDGYVLGMAGGYRPGGEAWLWGMWVDPAARRRGVGRALVEAVAAWADGPLRLSVTDCEEALPAARLYRELGFAETGETQRLESDPALLARVMLRPARGTPSRSSRCDADRA